MADFTILEPVSAGDIIDRAIRLYRRNLTPLIAVVAVPGVIYYISSLLFWFGYSRLLMGGGADFGGSELLMMAAGGFGMLVWLFTLLVAISGMARAIGDNVMAGEAITFRKCLRVATKRLGDIALMGLLTIALGLGMYVALVVVGTAMVLLVGVGAALGASLGVSPGVGAVLAVIALVLVAIGAVILLLSLVSRVVFLPQALMIEGQSAGSALGRAFKLGAKNWYKIGAIALFNYFVTFSLLLAMILPVAVVLYLTNSLTADLLLKPGWSALYTAANQLTSMLVLPIWITSFTLLYFDSRVRKEGYDIEVLSLGLQPAPQVAVPYWRPPMPGQPPWSGVPAGAPPGYQVGYRVGGYGETSGPPGTSPGYPPGYQAGYPPGYPPGYPSSYPPGYQGGYGPGYPPSQPGYRYGGYGAAGYPGAPPPPQPSRPYLQTSPLGLAGPRLPRPPASPSQGVVNPPNTAATAPPVTGPAAPAAPIAVVARETTPAVLIPSENAPPPTRVESELAICQSCGAATKRGARFCHICGNTMDGGSAGSQSGTDDSNGPGSGT